MAESELAYLLRRAKEEAALAAAATDTFAKAAHQRLADAYAERAKSHDIARLSDAGVIGLTSDGDQSSSGVPDQRRARQLDG